MLKLTITLKEHTYAIFIFRHDVNCIFFLLFQNITYYFIYDYLFKFKNSMMYAVKQ
jgi:hypothetical protein